MKCGRCGTEILSVQKGVVLSVRDGETLVCPNEFCAAQHAVMLAAELPKPCPFCAQPPDVVMKGFTSHDMKTMIEYTACEVVMKGFGEEVVKKWNRRNRW